MAIIICPKCNQNYSDKARCCPHCGYGKKRVSLYIILCIIIVIFLLITCTFFMKKNAEEKKIIRQEKIQHYLEQINSAYEKADFDDIERNIEALDNLGYDTNELRRVFDYDKSVYTVAANYYITMKRVCENVSNGEYVSLKEEYYKLKDVTEKFDKLEVNLNSRLGTWIDDYRHSGDYIAWNAFITGEYIDTIEITSFTEFIPVSMLETVAGPLLRKEFPIAIKEDL